MLDTLTHPQQSSEEPHNLTIKECSTVYASVHPQDPHKENSDRNYLHVLDQMMNVTAPSQKSMARKLLQKDLQN